MTAEFPTQELETIARFWDAEANGAGNLTGMLSEFRDSATACRQAIAAYNALDEELNDAGLVLKSMQDERDKYREQHEAERSARERAERNLAFEHAEKLINTRQIEELLAERERAERDAKRYMALRWWVEDDDADTELRVVGSYNEDDVQVLTDGHELDAHADAAVDHYAALASEGSPSSPAGLTADEKEMVARVANKWGFAQPAPSSPAPSTELQFQTDEFHGLTIRASPAPLLPESIFGSNYDSCERCGGINDGYGGPIDHVSHCGSSPVATEPETPQKNL